MKKKQFLFAMTAILTLLLVCTSSFALTGQRVIMPYIVSGTGSWWSGVAIHNTTNATLSIEFGARTESGTFISGRTVSVPPYGMIADLVPNLFTSPLPSSRVSLYITDGLAGTASTFRATLFVGSDKGFGLQSLTSETYEWLVPPIPSVS